MCNLTTNITKTKVTGYKVVAKHKETNEYHSVAFGFQYKQPTHTFSGLRKKQKVIAHFASNLLQFPKPQMKSRTAAFIRLKDARNLQRACIHSHDSRAWNSRKYRKVRDFYVIVVVKVKLQGNLAKGSFADSDVYAGRTITILKEMPF